MTEQPKGFFARIIDGIMAGVVVEELEADLYPVDEPGGRKIAELEFTRFKAGNTQFEIEIERRAQISAGEELAVLIHGVEVYRFTTQQFKSEVKLYSNRGDEVPPIKRGDEAALVHNGKVIATGVFRVDH